MAGSLLLPSLGPKILFPTKTRTPSLSPLFLTLSLTSKSRLLPSLYKKPPSILIRNVAVSSEWDQEEETSAEEANFPRDLKLYVGNLPFSVDSATLAGLFEQAGNVEMVEIIYDKTTGRSRGFGFVTMSTIEEVEAATQQFNGYELEGRSLRVNSGPPPQKDDFSSRGPRRSSFDSANRDYMGNDDFTSRGPRRSNFNSANRVHVGNLSWGVDDLALENLFSEQGKVIEARVVYDRESGRSRGFGFVTYSSAEEVNNAVSSLDGTDLNGRSIRVSPADARPPRRQF